MSTLSSAASKLAVSVNPNEALARFKTGILENAEKVIKEYLPIKIVELSELFESIQAKESEAERKRSEHSVVSQSEEKHSEEATSTSTSNDASSNSKQSKSKKKGHSKVSSRTNQKSQPNKKKRSFTQSMGQSQSQSRHKKDEDGDSAMDRVQRTKSDLCGMNNEIAELTKVVKKEVEALIAYLDQIALFINLHIPKIEDGNNFGVQVQEQMKSMVSGGQLSAQEFLRSIPKFHALRAKIVCKVLKYPNLSDYKRAMLELDAKQMLMLKHCLRDIRNNYWILYDVLSKNWSKITKPKGDKSTFSMY